MTPVEELRAAATKLREASVRPLECIEPICVGDLDEWTKYYGHECEDLPEGDAPWITVMTPLLAEPLARWLATSASHAMKVADPRNQEIIADQHALAVARVINGGER